MQKKTAEIMPKFEILQSGLCKRRLKRQISRQDLLLRVPKLVASPPATLCATGAKIASDRKVKQIENELFSLIHIF